ncbi:DUF397 domain-containing protein [Actinomadura sp. 9N407]|uniref:DUF397 domain-containing protein n=1 Tax=Actinomadura sp. 9N407 TaxID=3375154 RepID=UPI0037B93F47
MAQEHLQRQSTYSGNGGARIEAANVDGIAGIRDSKDPSGPVLTLTRSDWISLISSVTAVFKIAGWMRVRVSRSDRCGMSSRKWDEAPGAACRPADQLAGGVSSWALCATTAPSPGSAVGSFGRRSVGVGCGRWRNEGLRRDCRGGSATYPRV